jgi:hypothetical protein
MRVRMLGIGMRVKQGMKLDLHRALKHKLEA